MRMWKRFLLLLLVLPVLLMAVPAGAEASDVFVIRFGEKQEPFFQPHLDRHIFHLQQLPEYPKHRQPAEQEA